jgi:hypothetical protein
LETLSTSSAVFSTSSEVLSASSEVLLAKFLFSSTFNLISATIHRHRHQTRMISEDFLFDFLKIRSLFFGKPKPKMSHSTVLLGRSASSRLHQHVRPTTTRRCVNFKRLRVDLTRGCENNTRRHVERVLRRVLHPSDPQQCRRQFLRVSVVLRQPSPVRVFHVLINGFRAAAFLRLFPVFLRLLHRWCCCLSILLAFTFFFFPLSSLCRVLSPLFLFWNCLLVLLMSAAWVVLSGFSFLVVVVSFSDSKTF